MTASPQIAFSASQKMRPIFQPGASCLGNYRAREARRGYSWSISMSNDSAEITRNFDVAPARNLRGESTRKFSGDMRGNFRGENAKPLAFGITQTAWLETSAATMRAHVGDDRHAAKRLSNILECSPRTAENYLLGRTAPSGIHFLRAYAIIPEFTAEVRRLTGMEAAGDPAFDRDLALFLTRASRHLDSRTAKAEEAGSETP